MELHTIRSGNQESLESREYCIGIGISLGSKWFSIENVIALLKWALPRSRGHVVIYVADTIHAINLEARNRIPAERALRRVKEKGSSFLNELQLAAKEVFSSEDLNKLVYATWDDITDSKYKEKVSYLCELYASDTEFKSEILKIVTNWVSKEERVFSENDLEKMGTYVLEELPELMCKVQIKGIICDTYTYPKDDDLTRFVEQLQKGELFPYIRDSIMDTEPKVFLEVR